MFNSCQLFGQNRVELNTELRFLIASAKVDGAELLRVDPPTCEDEKENLRIIGCIIKVLRTLKKEGVIEFYVNREGFSANSTEAIFLLNKYSEYIDDKKAELSSVYIKL